MKRRICLLLCLLMLFCVSCQKEETPDTDNGADFVSEMSADSFYTSEGATYNVFVEMAVAAQEQIAPVTFLEAQICNNTDFIIVFNFDLDDGYKWEVWKDEKWVAYSNRIESNESGIKAEAVSMSPGPHYIMPRSSYTRMDDFSERPLEAGLYRLRINYKLTNEKRDFSQGFRTPGVPCVAEVYLTVAPAL